MAAYGASGIPINGVSGAAANVGDGLRAGWTAGLYYAVGDVTASILPDPTQVRLIHQLWEVDWRWRLDLGAQQTFTPAPSEFRVLLWPAMRLLFQEPRPQEAPPLLWW